MTASFCFNGCGRLAHAMSAYCQECISRQARPVGRSSADCGKCGARFISVTAFDSHQDVRTWSETRDGRTTYHASVTCLDPATIPGLVQRAEDGVWGRQASLDRREEFVTLHAARRDRLSAPQKACGLESPGLVGPGGIAVEGSVPGGVRFPPTEHNEAA